MIQKKKTNYDPDCSTKFVTIASQLHDGKMTLGVHLIAREDATSPKGEKAEALIVKYQILMRV